MATIRGPARALCTLGSALFILTGCDKLMNDDTHWARAALERNEQVSIVAFDKSTKTFTVRMKDTGELRMVRADQIVGTIPGDAQEPAAPKPASTAAAPSNTETSADAPIPASAPNANSNASGTGVITDPATGNVLATIDNAEQLDATENAQASNASTDDAAKPDAKSDRKVIASGPGYSIKAGDTLPPVPIRSASRSSNIHAPTRGVALERRSEPMICQGQRLLHIDGRNLEFEGDAISAEDGCEMHITNSHITAHGVGVSARAAKVHIKNSLIEGDSGSVSASEGARVYTQSSTFKGLSRRFDTATIQDLGGTVWQ